MNLVLELKTLGATWTLEPVESVSQPSNAHVTQLRLALTLPGREAPIDSLFTPNVPGLTVQEMLAYAIRGVSVDGSFDKRWKTYCGDVPVYCPALSVENVERSILAELSESAHPLAASLYVSLSQLRSNQSEALWARVTNALSEDVRIRKGTALRRWVAVCSLDAIRNALREQMEDSDQSIEESALTTPALYEARSISYLDWMRNALATLFVDKSI